MKRKYFTINGIMLIYGKLTLKNKISVLDSAIDVMQQWNGNTKERCIAIAMGYEPFYDEKSKTELWEEKP